MEALKLYFQTCRLLLLHFIQVGASCSIRLIKNSKPRFYAELSLIWLIVNIGKFSLSSYTTTFFTLQNLHLKKLSKPSFSISISSKTAYVIPLLVGINIPTLIQRITTIQAGFEVYQ